MNTPCPQCGWVHPTREQVALTGYQTLDTIIAKVCDIMGVTRVEVISQSRSRRYAEARHLVGALARYQTKLTFEEIGLALGGRDHTTVLQGCKSARRRMLSDHQFADIVWHYFPDYAKSIQSKAGAA